LAAVNSSSNNTPDLFSPANFYNCAMVALSMPGAGAAACAAGYQRIIHPNLDCSSFGGENDESMYYGLLPSPAGDLSGMWQ